MALISTSALILFSYFHYNDQNWFCNLSPKKGRLIVKQKQKNQKNPKKQKTPKNHD